MPDTKRCSQCGETFPATSDYFYKRGGKRKGFRAACKSCHAAQAEATRDPIKRREYERQWAAKNRESRRQSCRDWRARNLEEQRARERAVKEQDRARGKRSKGRQWRKKNKHKEREYRRVYARKNQDKLNLIVHRYRARKRNLPDHFTEADWRFALDYFNGCCAVCERPLNGLFHTAAADHWIPLTSSDCPGTVPTNMVPLCHGVDGCNNSKHNRNPEKWLIERHGTKAAKAILNRIHAYFEAVKN